MVSLKIRVPERQGKRMDEKEKPGSPDVESWAKGNREAHDIHGTEKRLQIMLETNFNLKNRIQLPLRQSGNPADLRFAYKEMENAMQKVIELEADRLRSLLQNP